MRWAASLQLPVDLLVFECFCFAAGRFHHTLRLLFFVNLQSQLATGRGAGNQNVSVWAWLRSHSGRFFSTKRLLRFNVLHAFQVSLDNSRNSGVFRGRYVLFYRGPQLGTVTCDHAELIGQCGDTSTFVSTPGSHLESVDTLFNLKYTPTKSIEVYTQVLTIQATRDTCWACKAASSPPRSYL
jgi:hypothetical protein